MARWFVVLLFSAGLAFGQGLAQPRAVTVRIQVRLDKDNSPVRDVQVELMDAVGSSSAMDKKFTDSDGRVEFRSFTGGHRLRITGAEIKTWEGEFEILPSEVVHVEHVRVVGRPPAGTSPAPAAPISATRLKIPKAAQKQYESGMKALQREQWAEAEAKFEGAIAAYDHFDLAQNGLGITKAHLGDMEGARKAFARAIELNPDYAEALRNLARIYVDEQRYGDAAPLLADSLSTEPVNVWATVTLAYVNLKTGKYEAAAAWGMKAHNLPSEDPTGHYIAGCALDALGNKAEAVQQFETYLQEEPQGANARAAREFLARLTASQ